MKLLIVILSLACFSSCKRQRSNSETREAGQGTDTAIPKVLQDTAKPSAFITIKGKQVFLSGFNLAWFNFAADFGKGLDEKRLRESIATLKEAGGNSLRWWVHTDGSTSPTWQGQGEQRLVAPLTEAFKQDFQKALDIAAENDIYIVPCLWSFDMLRKNDSRKPPNQDNFRLLSDDRVLDSYLNNVLAPMVKAFNKHPGLAAWELFNEPENMTEQWFRSQDVFYGGPGPSLEQLQRVQARMAATIHRAASEQGETALVTTGSKSTGKYNSEMGGRKNLYTDEALKAAAGGDALAYLDFYAPHYYNNEGQNGLWSPFHHPASHWQLSKPIVIGEFHVNTLAVEQGTVEADDLCKVLAEGGYAGAWTWSLTDANHQEQQRCVEKVKL